VSRLDSSSSEPRGVLVRRPRTSIYTMLLLVALLALVLGCLMLLIELYSYDFQFKPSGNLRASIAPAVATLEIA